jgi:hypothetical protein
MLINAREVLSLSENEMDLEDPRKPEEAAADRSRAQVYALQALALAVIQLTEAVKNLEDH